MQSVASTDDKYVDLHQRREEKAEQYQQTVADYAADAQAKETKQEQAEVEAIAAAAGAGVGNVVQLGDIKISDLRRRVERSTGTALDKCDRKYSFRGTQHVYVRRASSYFNSTATHSLRRVSNQSIAPNDGPNDSTEISHLKQKARKKKSDQVRAACLAATSKAGVTPLIVVLVWIVTGTLFYHFYTGFYWSQAFFYAVDTGFSIGFGMFVEGAWNDSDIYIPPGECTLESCEGGLAYNGSLRQACVQLSYRPDIGSMAYTVVHILVGSSLVATALTMMLVGTLDRSGLDTKEEKLLRDNLDREKTRKVHELKRIRRQAKISQSRSSKDLLRRQQLQEEAELRLHTLRMCWKGVVKIFELQLFKASCALVTWLALGMTFVVITEKWTFLEALYFAVSSLSTAGLLGPTHHNRGNETDLACGGDCQPLSMALTGIYCFIGVPLFAMVLGSAADFQIDRMQELRLQAKFQKAIDVEEFKFAAEKLKRAPKLAGAAAPVQVDVQGAQTQTDRQPPADNSEVKSAGLEHRIAVSRRWNDHETSIDFDDEFVVKLHRSGSTSTPPLRRASSGSSATPKVRTLDYLQYLQLSLLRTGLVEEDKLESIWKQFQTLDVDRSGDVSLSEVAAMNIFSKYDVDNSSSLDLLEFFLCVDDLRHAFPDVTYATDEEDLSIVFLKISSIVVRFPRRYSWWHLNFAPSDLLVLQSQVDREGNMHVPEHLDDFIGKWIQASQEERDAEIEDRVITRVQFQVWCKDKVRHSYYADDAGPSINTDGQIVHDVSSATPLVDVGASMDEARYELEAALHPSMLGAVAEEDEEEENEDSSSEEVDQELDLERDARANPNTSGEKTIELTEVDNSREHEQPKQRTIA